MPTRTSDLDYKRLHRYRRPPGKLTHPEAAQLDYDAVEIHVAVVNHWDSRPCAVYLRTILTKEGALVDERFAIFQEWANSPTTRAAARILIPVVYRSHYWKKAKTLRVYISDYAAFLSISKQRFTALNKLEYRPVLALYRCFKRCKDTIPRIEIHTGDPNYLYEKYDLMEHRYVRRRTVPTYEMLGLAGKNHVAHIRETRRRLGIWTDQTKNLASPD